MNTAVFEATSQTRDCQGTQVMQRAAGPWSHPCRPPRSRELSLCEAGSRKSHNQLMLYVRADYCRKTSENWSLLSLAIMQPGQVRVTMLAWSCSAATCPAVFNCCSCAVKRLPPIEDSHCIMMAESLRALALEASDNRVDASAGTQKTIH